MTARECPHPYSRAHRRSADCHSQVEKTAAADGVDAEFSRFREVRRAGWLEANNYEG